MNGNSMKLTKPYGSGNDNSSNNSASYSGYGIAKANKYQPSEVSNLVLSLVNYFSLGSNKDTCLRRKQSHEHTYWQFTNSLKQYI